MTCQAKEIVVEAYPSIRQMMFPKTPIDLEAITSAGREPLGSRVHGSSAVRPFFGAGRACIVWSSQLPGRAVSRSLQRMARVLSASDLQHHCWWTARSCVARL